MQRHSGIKVGGRAAFYWYKTHKGEILFTFSLLNNGLGQEKRQQPCYRCDWKVTGRTECEPLAGTELQATGSLRSERTLDPTKAVEPVMCLTCS